MHTATHAPARGVVAVEMWVGSAACTAPMLQRALGLRVTNDTHIAVGKWKRRRMVLQAGAVCVVLVAALDRADAPFHAFLRAHGDAVHALWIAVDDTAGALAHGGEAVEAVGDSAGAGAHIRVPLAGCPDGDVVWKVVHGTEAPALFAPTEHTALGMTGVDHAAVVLPPDAVEAAEAQARHVLGMTRYLCGRADDTGRGLEIRGSANGGMRTLAYAHTAGTAEAGALPSPPSWMLVLVAPLADARREGSDQILDFLHHHGGAGVQHVALATQDIVSAMDGMAAPVPFVPVPAAYYDTPAVSAAAPTLGAETWAAVRRLGVLVDASGEDESAHAPDEVLMQTFTLPLFDRPTFFLELIERRGGVGGFGQRNITALFDAVERTRAKPAE